MASNTEFSALRLRKENISVFQDLKLAYESRHFIRLSNDAFFCVLRDLALRSCPELGEDYARVLQGRAPGAPAPEGGPAADGPDPEEVMPSALD